MAVNGTSLNDVVTYTCETGYAMTGIGQRVCGMFADWEGNTYTCESTDFSVCIECLFKFLIVHVLYVGSILTYWLKGESAQSSFHSD